ncbi:DUF5133 domain-containing protein [Streptomyces sp. NPDC007088]|uniref:DUF5133 domain-containing protein n=1 Tax=Streptomyces sp. NPDC007088 TaxID=3364773 RepID=UPI0036B5A399
MTVLLAHPVVLRKLLARYASLAGQDRPTAETRRQLDDVTYTLCVSTGTRTIDAALAVARARVAEAAPQERTPRSVTGETSAILTA